MPNLCFVVQKLKINGHNQESLVRSEKGLLSRPLSSACSWTVDHFWLVAGQLSFYVFVTSLSPEFSLYCQANPTVTDLGCV